MRTLRDSAKEALIEYKDLIKFHEKNIKLFEKKLKGDLPDTKRKAYEGLLEVSKAELKECRESVKRILAGGYGEAEEETPEEKEQFKRLYKEWKSKYKEAK